MADLLAVAAEVAPDWLRRLVTERAPAGTLDADRRARLDEVVAAGTAGLLAALADLLAHDVDDQRTNPLSLFRDAVAGPTAMLRELGLPPAARDAFEAAAFPADVYGLAPATWAAVDPALHEPGIRWGAWKAMTVLARRRGEDPT